MTDNYDGTAGKIIRDPKATQNDYLMLSRLSKLLKRCVDQYLNGKNATVLDVGCGKKPYQPFFFGKCNMYIGIDVSQSKFVDVICSCDKLPFADNIFSVVLCTQVLEHVNEPKMMIDESCRVLKQNGLLFLSTHGNWPVHGAPQDYWRWTEYGLRKLLNANYHCEINECGGSMVSILQLLELYIPGKYLGSAVRFAINKLADFLDKFEWLNSKFPHLATTYFVVANPKKNTNVSSSCIKGM
jgi:SAM-dependent methyltransferase